MATTSEEEIPIDAWEEFCEGFGWSHRGWRMSLGIIDPVYGPNGPEDQRDEGTYEDDEPRPRILASDLALDRIRMGRVAGHIEVMVIAGSGASRVEHRIHAVQRVTLVKPTKSLDPNLRIESATGHITIIEVARPAETLPSNRDASAQGVAGESRTAPDPISNPAQLPVAGSAIKL